MECKKQQVEEVEEEVNVVVYDKSKRNEFIDDDIDLDGIFNKAQTLEIGTDVDLDDLETTHNKNLVKSNYNKNVLNKNNNNNNVKKNNDEISNENKSNNLIYKSAINLNKLAYESLKMNYIAKSFHDPPAGFGSVGHHPKYIFLDNNINNKLIQQQHQQELKKHQQNNQYHKDFNTSSLPLKVWRGYHGNIYFEPFQLSNLKQNNNLVDEALKKLENNSNNNNNNNNNKNNNLINNDIIKKCQKIKSAPVTKTKQAIENKNNNNIRTNSCNRSEHLLNQSDLIFIHHLTSSTSKINLSKRPPSKHSNKFQSKSSADLTNNHNLSIQNVQNHSDQNNSIQIDDDKKSYHIVLPSNEIEKSEHTSTHHHNIQSNSNNSSSTSSSPPNKTFITEYNPELYFYTNNTHSSKSFCFNCSIDKMNDSNLQIATAPNGKKFQIRHFNTPLSNIEKEILYADNHSLKRKTNVSNATNKSVSSAKPILPNLSAVKKQNIPIKGLAFRELTQRILLSNKENNNQHNDFEEAYLELNIQSRNVYIDNNEKKTALIEASLLNTNTINSNNSTNNNNNVSSYRNYKQMLRNVKKGVTLNQREKTEIYSSGNNKENRNLSMSTPFTNGASNVNQNNSQNNSKSNSKNSKTSSSTSNQHSIQISKSASIANRQNRSVSQNVLKKLKIKGAKIDVTNINSLSDDRPLLYQHPHAPPSTSLGYERKSTHYIQNHSSLNNSITIDLNYNSNNRIKSDKSYPSSSNHTIKRINPTPDIY